MQFITSYKDQPLLCDISTILVNNNVLTINGDITSTMCTQIVQAIHYLAAKSDDPITLYINSPGGEVSAGFGIIDAMNDVDNIIVTQAVGRAMSMASLILASGTKGYRYAAENCDIMIHQPLTTGLSGKASDISNYTEHLLYLKRKSNQLLVNTTGQDIKVIEQLTLMDSYLTSKQALDLHLIDNIGFYRE